MFFIGIDVHKRQYQICILDEQGAVHYETRVPTSRPDLADVLRAYVPARVVLEASAPSEWVARHLESLGMEVIVADPGFAPMYATRDKKIKTDKRDARMLANACKLGAFKPAHRLSDMQREVRTLVQVRQTLVQTRTRLTNQLGGLLLAQGYVIATGAPEYFAKRLTALQVPEALRKILEPLCSLLGPLNERIEEMDRQLATLAHKDEQATRLQQIPGVGPITSLMFIAVLDGAKRFEDAHQVMSYLGLVSRERSSGEKQMRGRITKAGHCQMRVLLVQAAMRVLRLKKPQTERLHQWAEKIKERRGIRIAAVALARRLCGVMWAMLRDGTEYQAEPPGRSTGAEQSSQQTQRNSLAA